MSDQGRQAAKFAALVAGGAVLGAGLGILFAPQSGTETRRDISRYAKRAQVQATRFGRTIKSGVAEAVERGKIIVHQRDRTSTVQAA